MNLSAYQANYQPIDLGYGNIKAQPEPKKKKNFWLDQISTAGGILGGIGGSFVAPIAGTAVGAGAGSALGEALENAITGDSLTKNVAKEGVLGGVLGAGPLRLGRMALGVGGRAAAGAAGKALTRPATQKAAENLLSEAWGIRAGVKIAGRAVTPQREQALQKFAINTLRVPRTANAKMVFEKATQFQDEAGNAISSAVKAAKPIQTSNIVNNLNSKFTRVIGGNGGNNPVASDILSQIKTAKTPEQLWQVRREIDDTLINFNRNPSAVVPGGERFAKLARNEINKELNKSIPGFSQLNRTYSDTLDIAELTAAAAKTPRGINMPGMFGRVGGQSVQRGRAALGTTLDSISPQAVRQGAGTVARTGPSKRAIIRNVGLGGLLTSGGSQQPQQDASLEDALMTQSGGLEAQPSAQQSPYTRENLLYDISRDPENADDYIGYYQSLQEVFGSPEEKLNSTASGVVADTETGLLALQDLSQNIAESGVNNPGIGQLRGLNPFDTEAQKLQANIATAKQIVGKALEGGVLRKEDEYKYAKILPKLGDTDATAQYKIQQLIGLISNRLNEYKSNIGAGTTLEDAVMQQAQGGYR